MGTSVERASAVSEIRQKAEGYGMTSERSRRNGYDGSARASSRNDRADPRRITARSSWRSSPTASAATRWATRNVTANWKRSTSGRKTIRSAFTANILLKNKIASEAELDEQDDLAETEVTEAVEFAEASPEPAPKSCSGISTWKNRGGRQNGKNHDA